MQAMEVLKRPLRPVRDFLYSLPLKYELAFSSRFTVHQKASNDCRVLYVSPMSIYGKPLLKKILESVDIPNIDFLLFVYDGSVFDEPFFERCKFIYEKGLKWQYMKKYLTEEYCRPYDYIFIWDDDLELQTFSFRQFIEIMQRNGLELAQPALTHTSYFSHKITLQTNQKVGRFTTFVEVMAPVFTREAWSRFWGMISETDNYWGWGYDLLARSRCHYKRMGIVDSQTVRHTRPVRSQNFGAEEEMISFLKRHRRTRRCVMINYGELR